MNKKIKTIRIEIKDEHTGSIVKEIRYMDIDIDINNTSLNKNGELSQIIDITKHKLHSLTEPSRVKSDGSEFWYVDGRLHRSCEPAVILGDGTKAWFIYGKLHRLDGPAIEFPSGLTEWYFSGDRMTISHYLEYIDVEVAAKLKIEYSDEIQDEHKNA